MEVLHIATAFLLLTILIISVCGKRTDKCIKRYNHCGDNKCCCKQTNAQCFDFKNKLQYIPNLPSEIQTLDFRYNLLQSVTANTFKNLTNLNLTQLLIHDNDIRNISRDAFIQFRHLRVIDLSGNSKINKTELSFALGSVQKTQNVSLLLKQIGLKVLNEDFFTLMENGNVSKILLSGNKISNLNLTAFQGLRNLKSLIIKSNGIVSITGNAVLGALTELNLSANNMTCPVTFCYKENSMTVSKFPNLKSLDISRNYMSVIVPEKWNCLHKLKNLDISENCLYILSDNVFSTFRNLQSLDIRDVRGQIKYIQPKAFNISNLRYLSLAGNNIQFKKIVETNIFQFLKNLISLDVSYNSFRHIDESNITKLLSPMKNLSILKMKGVKLYEIPKKLLSKFHNLTLLNVDENEIFDLKTALNNRNAGNLLTLSVQANNLGIIQKDTFNGYNTKSLKHLNLAHNPFECTCKLRWFRQWIDSIKPETKLDRWPGGYRCWSPSEMNSTLLENYHPTEESCRYHDPMTVAYVTIGSFMCVFVISSIIIYNYRWHIRYMIFKMKRKVCIQNYVGERLPLLGQEECFDGYVLFSEEDHAFLTELLVPTLEDEYGYKIHAGERDEIKAGHKIEIMAESMCASRHLVVIISDAFLRDKWCMFQLHVALDIQIRQKTDCLILITLDNIDVKGLNSYLCVVLTKSQTAHWCENREDFKRKLFEQKIKQQFGPPIQRR